MMDFALSITGAAEREAELLKFARMLDRPVINAFRRGVRRIASQIRPSFLGTGIGRAIWGKRASGLSKLVYGMRVTKVGDELQTGIKLKGIPALLEDGGRILPHVIKPKNAPFLVFQAGGRWVRTAKGVRHPGMPLLAHNFARTAIARETPAIIEDLNREIGILKQETFG